MSTIDDYPGWDAETVDTEEPTMCIDCLDEQPAGTTMTVNDWGLVCPDCRQAGPT